MPETLSASLKIVNKYGLHARPATDFAAGAQRFACEVVVCNGGTRADGKSIMELMMLAATSGTEIEVCCTGADAADCLAFLRALVARGFDEED